jgi:neutral ceramidase
MNRLLRLLTVGLAAFWSLAVGAAEWKVGIAQVEITPERPVWMAGYAARDHPAEGTVHPLWAKALMVEDGRGQRAVIVTTDLIGLVRDVSDTVGARVHQRTGVPRERIVLSSSHTHCGPVVVGCADNAHHMGSDEWAAAEAYRRKLEDRLVDVIAAACAKTQPASVAFGEGTATFAMNRRKVRDQGYAISPNPAGPVDHRVPVLRVTDQDDRPLAVLFGYACHNTTPILSPEGSWSTPGSTAKSWPRRSIACSPASCVRSGGRFRLPWIGSTCRLSIRPPRRS